MTQVDHLIQAGAEEIVGGHRLQSSIHQELTPIGFDPAEIDHRHSPETRLGTTGYGIIQGRLSNLALKFLGAGFLPEATKLLESASMVADHHKNVDSSLSRAKSAESAEQKKADDALAIAPPVSDFYRAFGAAAAKSLSSPLSGTWVGPSCLLEFVQSDDMVAAKGTYPEPVGILARAFTKPKGSFGFEDAPTTLEVKYRGRMQGRVAIGTMTVRKLGAALPQAASSLLGDSDRTTVLMWLSDDEAKLSVLERSGSTAPRYYDIVRT